MADAEDSVVGTADELPDGTWSVARLNVEIETVRDRRTLVDA